MSLKKWSLCLALPLAGGLLMGSGHDSYEPCPQDVDLILHVDGDNGIIFSPPGGAVTDGDSWQNAYWLLQDALDHARAFLLDDQTGQQTVLIKVASTSELNPYRPDQRWNHPATCPEIDVVTCLNLKDFTNSCAPEGECPCCPPFGDCDTDVAFELHNRVVIFGGFPPGGGTCEQRNPKTYRTLLSGDLGAVRARRVDSSAVLDGFVIESKRGSALTIIGASPTIRNCSLTSGELNIAALTVRSTNDVISAPRFLACTFHIEEDAAAIDENAEPVFIGCTIAGEFRTLRTAAACAGTR